jgi:hypothetical protein
MPKTSKSSASQVFSMEGFEGCYEDLAGYTVGFETHAADGAMTSAFAGLPDDRCQCPHWGYVLKGKVGYRFVDREETFTEGEAYYAAPGHVPVLYAGTELVEFSPTEELAKTSEVVDKNLAKMAPST